MEEARLRLRAQEVSKLSSSKRSDCIRNTLYTMLNEREVLFAGEGAENVGSGGGDLLLNMGNVIVFCIS